MNKEQYTYIIRYGVAAAAVAALCAPVVWRTEAMPSVSDVWVVAALAVLALTAVCLEQRLPRLHWADGVVLFWWVCVSLNYVFVSPYPAAEAYGKAMALGVAYVALRLVIPFCGRAFTFGGSDCVRRAAMSFGRVSCSWRVGRHPGIICST